MTANAFAATITIKYNDLKCLIAQGKNETLSANDARPKYQQEL